MAVKPIAIKVTAGIIGTGGAIVIAQQGYQALQNKSKPSNSNKLISEKYTVLGKRAEDEGNWITILDSYKKAVKIDSKLGFVNFDGTLPNDTQEQKARERLKKNCDSALSSKDESLLDKARKWCVTPISVKELLEARDYIPLKTEGNVNDEKAKWEEKITNFWKAKKENPNIEKIITNEEKTPIEESIISEIKKKCGKVSKIMSHKEEFKSSLESFQLWCANKK